MQLTPTIAIVGRPNVGKSSLFNRLVGRRQAIVHDQPGVTRDRIVALANLDPTHAVQLVDTGGLVPGDDPLGLGKQVLMALADSDLVVVVVDGSEGLVPADELVVAEVRRLGKPWILAVNKGDTTLAKRNAGEFHRLGVEALVLISAEHGGGIGELVDELVARLPAVQVETRPDLPGLAVVGRPNVGKSSLVNRLLGQERVLVSPIPGTTRDPVDCVITRGERSYLLVDTAGIRRRSKTSGAAEELAVLFARRQLERADVAILLIDAAAGVTSGDLAIAGLVNEVGRAAVVGINKWDLLDERRREALEATWPRLDQLLSGPTRVNLSALSGRGLEKLFPAVDRALVGFRREVSTGELNRLAQEIVLEHRPPAHDGRPWRLLYATQVATGPPTFMLFANHSLSLRDSYRRYLENRLRERLELEGVPLRLVIRRRDRGGDGSR